ncbi:recombinase family protein [Pelagibacterium lacus]|uniref:Recombinase family protein n=1 Tax=Pelagibacterium lacus TaxID=2282655 RepID=A0A369W5I5_9HYPH|nr:recombinase family protein [Pelagibacterium lacus]RDE09934.1 recombinase family protein [Pelagibacterium lacus]
MKRIRCAIYTRKSSEEGLEQDFNSLDAQHAACAAYVASQTSEGWTLIDKRYDDGGISGGTLERPGLQRLLADIAAGGIDIVVVYKVDRLTRSLLDFAKLVEAFDKAGTSFVSITQSFNTTTSMGRLTLNMLLSFAQFEREVTAERIRDKLAASNARGMWMGGTPPLGYRPDGRTLAIVDVHADLVRQIFALYLHLGNVRLLQNELLDKGIIKPVRISKAGRSFGGTAFTRGELYAMLSNPIYIGRIRHKDKIHNGLHTPIIDQDLWNAVQAKLADNRTGKSHIRAAAHPNLLAGKLFDDAGEKMVASHANKGARRYRYYVSRALQHGGDAANNSGIRIPAPEIESLVCTRLAELFDDPFNLVEGMAVPDMAPDTIAKAVAEAKILAGMLRSSDPQPLVQLTEEIVERIDIGPGAITLSLDSQKIAGLLGFDSGITSPSSPLELTVPVRLKRSGLAMRLILPGGEHAASRVDDKLIKAIARAHGWWAELMDNPQLGIADLAARHGITQSWATRMLRLAFLDPAIVELILDGKAPAHLTLGALKDAEAVPTLWSTLRTQHRISIAR